MDNVNDNFFTQASATFATTLADNVTGGDSTVPVLDGGTKPNGTPHVLTVNAGTDSQATFHGVKQDNEFINCVWTEGDVSGSFSSGDPVIDVVSATHHNSTSKGILVSHNQDGTLKSNIVSGQNITDTDGLLRDTKYFTSSGTWTKPANLKFVVVEVQGAGGSGGNSTGAGSGQASSSAGGGAGGYALKKIDAGDLGSTETVTIGTNTRNTGVGVDGSDGGASSFGSHCTGEGGKGGSGAGVVAAAGRWFGGAGGDATGGDLNIRGHDGNNGVVSGVYPHFANWGATSRFGVSRRPSHASNGKSYGYGAGGVGANARQGDGAHAGGSGADGIVIVHEYF